MTIAKKRSAAGGTSALAWVGAAVAVVGGGGAVLTVVNSPAKTSAGPDQSIRLPLNSVVLNGIINGATAEWVQRTGPAAALIEWPHNVSTRVTVSTPGAYGFDLISRDAKGKVVGRDHVNVRLLPALKPSKTVNAGPDLSIALPETRVTLQGTAGGPNVQWQQIGGPALVSFLNPAVASTPVAADVPGTYTLRLTVSDTSGKPLRSDDMQLTVGTNPTQIGANSTPLDHVKSFNWPAFRKGNTLLPLTPSSCAVESGITAELVRKWGYGAFLNEGTNLGDDRQLDLLRSEPGKYPVAFGQASLYGIFNNYNGANPGYPVLPADTYVRDANGKIVLRGGNPIVSPIATDAALQIVGEHVGRAMRKIEDATGQRINLVQNGGEYGLWIPGDNEPWDIWGVDPKVNKAMVDAGLDPRDHEDWWQFLSKNKARQERIIKETAYQSLARGRPDAYEWYGEAWGTERGRWAGWPWYNFRWDAFIGADGKPTVSDYASPEMYYNFHNTGWAGLSEQQGIPLDGLTLILRNAGGMRTLGQNLIYPFVSQGWDGGDSGGISDDDTFIGAIKEIYTAGAVGAAVGYFTCDGAPFQAMRTNGIVGNKIPTQVRGLINVAKVHALFTYLEPFLRNGDLLPGDGDHPFTSWDITTPSMEFNVRDEVDAPREWWRGTSWGLRKARVLARKMRGADRWLVTAWANTGNDRDIRVTIDPRLGELTLKARRAGSVYIVELVNGEVRQKLIDTDALNPTKTLFPEQGTL